jgi:predicted nuclease of predicted toxin-antitoxin system
MRLLLDAHLSGKVIGRHLRRGGHDVFALDERQDLEGIDDPEVLALAASENRILVTHNVKDFPDILRDWAEEGRPHSGCIVVVGIELDRFALLISAIEAALETGTKQEAWVNRWLLVGRGG